MPKTRDHVEMGEAPTTDGGDVGVCPPMPTDPREMGAWKVEVARLQAARVERAAQPFAPPKGSEPHPPSDIPSTSVLARAAGPWGPLTSLPPTAQELMQAPPRREWAVQPSWERFEQHVEEGVNVPRLNQQLGVLARHLMLAALWEEEGWSSKKERFDACVAAVKAVEGAKGELWVQQGPKRDYTQEELAKEREEVDGRLRRLLAQGKRGEGVTVQQAVEAALAAVGKEEGVVDVEPT